MDKKRSSGLAVVLVLCAAAAITGCDKIKGLTGKGKGENVVATAEGPAGVPPTPGGATQPASSNELKVGDKLLVEWKGQVYPATITIVKGPNLYLIHYDGWGHEWDEVITSGRIRGRVGGGALPTPAPAAAGAAGDFKVGDKVTVEWKGALYPATITAVRGNLYAIHYDGWGSEWDETITTARIKGRR